MVPPPPSQSFGDPAEVGPHPSYIQVAKPYIFDRKIQDCLSAAGLSEAKDDSIRLQGITWIENVRRALRLYVMNCGYPRSAQGNGTRPLRTFNTAVVYFLKFRLMHLDSMGYIVGTIFCCSDSFALSSVFCTFSCFFSVYVCPPD